MKSGPVRHHQWCSLDSRPVPFRKQFLNGMLGLLLVRVRRQPEEVIGSLARLIQRDRRYIENAGSVVAGFEFLDETRGSVLEQYEFLVGKSRVTSPLWAQSQEIP